MFLELTENAMFYISALALSKEKEENAATLSELAFKWNGNGAWFEVNSDSVCDDQLYLTWPEEDDDEENDEDCDNGSDCVVVYV